jgi:GTP-binding protein
VKAELERRGYEAFAISAVAQTGVRELLFRAGALLETAPPAPVFDELPVYRPAFEADEFKVTREPDGAFRVSGKKIERAARMTYWEYDQAVYRFQRILEALGVKQGLEAAGVREGNTVRIGEYELEWSD